MLGEGDDGKMRGGLGEGRRRKERLEKRRMTEQEEGRRS